MTSPGRRQGRTARFSKLVTLVRTWSVSLSLSLSLSLSNSLCLCASEPLPPDRFVVAGLAGSLFDRDTSRNRFALVLVPPEISCRKAGDMSLFCLFFWVPRCCGGGGHENSRGRASVHVNERPFIQCVRTLRSTCKNIKGLRNQ